ncbi:hypothetical protein [Salidesulfovibrio onnuriiensis]|uniref:hypothetical protein n=1 Tax=Salidesulfovibrio onnuriiensis TaxID=2583823 RepID=UPI0011CA2C1D|nr:hypothetical protein [Salidesulfovibrio onnuriiensis]
MKKIRDLSKAGKFEFDAREGKKIREKLPDMHEELKENYPNVVGVGVGPRFRDGMPQEETCLHVLVKSKIAPDALKDGESIPKVFHGFSVDVLEVGEAQLLARTSKQRPLLAGYSGGGVYKDAHCMGTLGSFVTKDERRFVLSNNHVLAANDLFPVDQTKVTQPAVQDGGTGDEIGTLKECIALSTTKDNLVDAAIAEVDDEIEIAEQRFYEKAIVPEADIKVFDPIFKVGRTTDRTEGWVVSLHLRVDVGGRMFANQVLVHIKAGVGDSGSLGIRTTDKHPMGLLFAGDIRIDSIYFNPIETVLDLFGVTMY